MAEGEKQIDAGLEVLFKLIADMQSAQAEGIKAGNAIRAEISRQGFTIRPTADMSAVKGMAGDAAKIIQDTADKLKFSFTAIGKAEDLQAGLRNVQAQLERIVETSGKIDMSFGGQTMRLSGKSTVAPFINQFKELAGVTTAEGGDVKLGISGVTENGKAQLDAARQVREFTDTTKKLIPYWKEALYAWGSGSRPQRGMSSLATGALTPILGDIGGNLAGGLAGLVAGGAIFHIGWAITSALSKIPEVIGQHIAENQAIDVMRARMVAIPAENIEGGSHAAASADAKTLLDLGVGHNLAQRLGGNAKSGQDFQNALNDLVVEYMGNVTNASARGTIEGHLNKDALYASIGNIMGGMDNPSTLASAYEDMIRNQSAAGMETLLKQKGMKRYIIGQERDRIEKGTSTYPEMAHRSDDALWQQIQQDMIQQIQSPVEAIRDQDVAAAKSAFQHVVRSPQNVAAFTTKMNQTQFGVGFNELYDEYAGSKEKFSTEQIDFISDYIGKRKGGLFNNPMGSDEAYKAVTSWFTKRSNMSEKQIKDIIPVAEAYVGNLDPLLGGMDEYKFDKFRQYKFSTFSNTGLQAHMQAMGGMHIINGESPSAGPAEASMQAVPAVAATSDATQATAGNTAAAIPLLTQIRDKLDKQTPGNMLHQLGSWISGN